MTDLTLILGELRLIGERLAKLETHMESLVGNGQPGRLTVVENKVSELQRWRWRIAGIATGLSAALTVILHFWK